MNVIFKLWDLTNIMSFSLSCYFFMILKLFLNFCMFDLSYGKKPRHLIIFLSFHDFNV